MRACWRTKKSKEEEDETASIRNGRMLLHNLIATTNGKCNPMRTFSSEEIMRATNNYDGQQILVDEGFFVLYKGFLQDRAVTIKKFRRLLEEEEESFNEIVFASGMSAHKNSLKLLGCCLETKLPVLVFEPVQNGTVFDRIHGSEGANFQPLLLKSRLKIAMEIASAIAYLHTAFSRPVVHRHIRASNIFLDEENVAKLSDYSLSVAIPEGETHVECDGVVGTLGHVSHDYATTGRCNEQDDVFSYGVFLHELLTGQLASDLIMRFKMHKYPEIVDCVIVGEGAWQGNEEQREAFKAFVLRCVSDVANDRPTMIDVAKVLTHMYRYVP